VERKTIFAERIERRVAALPLCCIYWEGDPEEHAGNVTTSRTTFDDENAILSTSV